jgi:hypothetical protein
MPSYKKQPVNYLEQIPFRKVMEQSEQDGLITLLIPKFRNAWFRMWFIPKRKSSYFRIHLDILGSQVWRTIDGKKHVQEICILLNQYLAEQNLSTNQLEERVTAFLTDLAKKGFISFNEVRPQSNE